MQNLPYVLSEYEEINSLLYKPINSTQRIKYTCFNTSTNYIVVGSTSGSIYLFSREPCTFLQLIPLSEGAVSRVLISPDEKTIALATTRGSVCLVALKPTPKLIAVSTEHVYEQINCLCWNDNSSEVYIGDGAGKVSVIVLSIFTVNGMFQAPACALMNLDSAIVQLSFSSPLLLASTLTRCYICDTFQEQYKQIGNKVRNGEFGACFYKTSHGVENSSSQRDEKLTNRKRSFSFIPDNDSNVQLENCPKIFCARPGSRLWEVFANGVVLKTHQFKEALAVPSVTICKSNIRRSSNRRQEEESWMPQSVNFSQLFVIADKYLFSYTATALYVIDPVNATVLLWCNEFTNITMAETIENRIYLMTCDGEFRCLLLSTLDSLILRLYAKKRYHDCWQLCLSYKSQLENLISETEIDKICDTDNTLLQDDELSTILHPVIRSLQSNLETCPVKLDSGIVVVNPGNSELKNEESYKYKSKMQNPSQQSVESSTHAQLENELENISIDSSTNYDSPERDNEIDNVNRNVESAIDKHVNENTTNDTRKDITQRMQDDLEAIYTLASKIKPSTKEMELERIISDVERRLDTIQSTYEPLVELQSFVYEMTRSAEFYYLSILLENTSVQMIASIDSGLVIKKLVDAFVKVNTQNYERCDCNCLRPADQLFEPKFLGVGRSLLRKLNENEDVEEEAVKICNEVPYMWREYLPVYIEKKHSLNELLRQCLLTRDNIVLSLLLPLLDERHWNLCVAYLAEMREGRCLFCGKSGKRTSRESLIDWSGVTREITRKQGPDVAMTFLMKLEQSIPNFSIDKSIFQSLVFTKILYQHGMKYAVDFNKSTLGSSEYNTMCSTKIRDQLVEVLEKDVGRPINKSIFGNGAHHWGMRYKNKSSTCPCCTLSLQTPVLLGNNGIAIFCCGHAYHVNCMIEKKLTTCNLH